MKIVEKYIKINMDRACLRWNQAREKYEIGDYRTAANLYADAIILYYKCAQDLIEGTGFIDEKVSISEMQSKEIMCREDFERAFHVGLAEKCCANCKHGECECEGLAICSHPERNDDGYMYEEEDPDLKCYSCNVYQCNVCDLWEMKGEAK